MSPEIAVVVVIVMIAIAYLIETLVEAVFGIVFDKFPKLTPWKWLLMYIAIAVGILATLIYRFDVIYLLATYLGLDKTIPIFQNVTVIGMIITGVAIGKGSNYLHDFLKRFFVKSGAGSTDSTT